jgi:hypothetical protein
MVKDCALANCGQLTSGNSTMTKDRIVKEATWFAVLLFIGLVILPISIYVVGNAVFGEYGAGGFGDFYGQLLTNFFGGEPAVLFLLLSPYLLWQLCRLTLWTFRHLRRSPSPSH